MTNKVNTLLEKLSDVYIGNTPLVFLKKYGVYAKFERTNPMGSVKDRPVYFMLKDAIINGQINENTILVEPTSGNTGIALAYFGAKLGLKVLIVMPKSVSVERKQILQSLGAEVVLVENMSLAVLKVREIVQNGNAYTLNQFANPKNPLAHELTTAPEILRDMSHDIDAFVAGVGTGGTITGVGKVLKKLFGSKVKIIALEPSQSAILSGRQHSPHRIQGIGPGFVPDIVDKSVIDEVIQIDDEEAVKFTKKLWKEGLFVGISSSANLLGSIIVREKYKLDKVVTVFPDDGSKYISVI
ncbi:MAG: cysteine synthase family protein [Fervidobacterium sp.]